VSHHFQQEMLIVWLIMTSMDARIVWIDHTVDQTGRKAAPCTVSATRDRLIRCIIFESSWRCNAPGGCVASRTLGWSHCVCLVGSYLVARRSLVGVLGRSAGLRHVVFGWTKGRSSSRQAVSATHQAFDDGPECSVGLGWRG